MKNILILAAILNFRFPGKAESKWRGSTTKFHHLPLEKLCIKFGAFVRPVNIILKNYVKEPDYYASLHADYIFNNLYIII